jgi:hypothetical protein
MEHLVHPRRREVLRQAIPHEMFKRDGVAMVANGAVWCLTFPEQKIELERPMPTRDAVWF